MTETTAAAGPVVSAEAHRPARTFAFVRDENIDGWRMPRVTICAACREPWPCATERAGQAGGADEGDGGDAE